VVTWFWVKNRIHNPFIGSGMMNEWITAFYRKRDNHWNQIDFHSHNEYEIYLFHGGNCKFLIRDRIYQLQPGDIILMNGLTLHRATPLPTMPYVRSVIQFSPEWIRPVISSLDMPELLDPFHKFNNCLFRLKDNVKLDRIDDLIRTIASLVSDSEITLVPHEDPLTRGRFRVGNVKMLLTQLLFQIYEWSQSYLIDSPHVESEKQRHVERIIGWIDQHFTEKISLSSLAATLNLSKFYISHVFKEVTGTTVMDYLMNCRLNRAKYLLEMHPEMSILDISLAAGFESSAHFSRFFRLKLGMTPTEYRKRRTTSSQQLHLSNRKG
jgi:AraC-like DNA-binding protein